MDQATFIFKGADGRDVFTRCWNNVERPCGILQVFHGMAEHSGRYEEFALYMNSVGFVVYACDQRGHGITGEMSGNLCHFDGDGFNGIVEDQKRLSELIKEKHPGIPLFIFGHSFGSFVAQQYIKSYGNEISGVVLSGSNMMNGMDVKAGYLVAALSNIFGSNKKNKLLDKLSFGSYNRGIKNPESKFSWLSRDTQQVLKYEQDRFCGGVMTTGFYYYFFRGLVNLYNTESMEKIPKNLPIYIMSGESDPVGSYGKGIKKLCQRYTELGIKDVKLKLYSGGRHEMLNEINRSDVYSDIRNWLVKHI